MPPPIRIYDGACDAQLILVSACLSQDLAARTAERDAARQAWNLILPRALKARQPHYCYSRVRASRMGQGRVRAAGSSCHSDLRHLWLREGIWKDSGNVCIYSFVWMELDGWMDGLVVCRV